MHTKPGFDSGSVNLNELNCQDVSKCPIYPNITLYCAGKWAKTVGLEILSRLRLYNSLNDNNLQDKGGETDLYVFCKNRQYFMCQPRQYIYQGILSAGISGRSIRLDVITGTGWILVTNYWEPGLRNWKCEIYLLWTLNLGWMENNEWLVTLAFILAMVPPFPLSSLSSLLPFSSHFPFLLRSPPRYLSSSQWEPGTDHSSLIQMFYPISLQPDGLNLWYFKLWLIDSAIIQFEI